MIENKKGFTLIELLVTIAIITLLASIIFASVSSARTKAEKAKARVQAGEIKKAVELSRLSNGVFPSQTSDSTTIEDILLSGSDSPLKTSLLENYPGGTPEAIIETLSISDRVASPSDGENEYYYISNGNDAIDEDGREYFCGMSYFPSSSWQSYGAGYVAKEELVRTNEDSIVFYKRDMIEWFEGGPINEYIYPAMGYSLVDVISKDTIEHHSNTLYYFDDDQNIDLPSFADDYHIHITGNDDQDYFVIVPLWQEEGFDDAYRTFGCN